jgi:hypothetical protein
MGVTINESLTLPSQITIPSYYARLRGNIVTIKQRAAPGMVPGGGVTYSIEAFFEVYASKEAYEANAGVIESKRIALAQTEPFTGNLYDIVYDELKKDVTDFVDDV